MFRFFLIISMGKNSAGQTVIYFNTRTCNSFLNTCEVCNGNKKVIFYLFFYQLLLFQHTLLY
jgi:hypothetical protein